MRSVAAGAAIAAGAAKSASGGVRLLVTSIVAAAVLSAVAAWSPAVSCAADTRVAAVATATSVPALGRVARERRGKEIHRSAAHEDAAAKGIAAWATGAAISTRTAAAAVATLASPPAVTSATTGAIKAGSHNATTGPPPAPDGASSAATATSTVVAHPIGTFRAPGTTVATLGASAAVAAVSAFGGVIEECHGKEIHRPALHEDAAARSIAGGAASTAICTQASRTSRASRTTSSTRSSRASPATAAARASP
jgi:hypothetical protein